GDAAPDPAAPPRARTLRADLRVHLAERDRPPRGGARADAHQPLSMVRALGRRSSQEAIARTSEEQRCILGSSSRNRERAWTRRRRSEKPSSWPSWRTLGGSTACGS